MHAARSRRSLLLASLLALPAAAACESSGGGGGGDVVFDTSGGDTASASVCERWNADRADMSEGDYSGDPATCDPGELYAPGPENTLRLVNLYRWMAGLPPVALDAGKSADAQACAVMMDANDDIEHVPPASWDCRTAAALAAAKLSNLATTRAVAAVDLYMNDVGVPNLGHRRWILSNTLGPIGVGSTRAYSCLHVIGGDGHAGARWTAWPPPGDFPIQAARTLPWARLEAAGWSLQSDTLDLRGAEVKVFRDGQEQPVTVDTGLDTGYGSTFGVRIVPQGWTMQAGRTYSVAVRGLAEDIDYDIHVVDCGT
ncbi:MAG: CAP domain-containing protein [Deltaproteobacteria bacterium]|nr:MAG: CAP domain-containing protein [Deltaproteobacteria bacterium]